MSNTVNHPSHYTAAGATYESINIIEAWSLGFHLGNVVKYVLRAGRKDATKEIEDLSKAKWYLERRIEQLRKREQSNQATS